MDNSAMSSASTALNPAIWPNKAARMASGELQVAGVSVIELADQYATPLYIYDADEIYARALQMKTAFDLQPLPCDVHYASKAFLSKAVANIINKAGLHLDVASGGELTIALAAKFPAANIAFHGNNKSDAEIDLAISSGVGHIVIDSLQEIKRVATLAEKYKIQQAVMLRATLGIAAETHEFISTAHEDQKFGLSAADGSLERAAQQLVQHDNLRLIGLHSHIGSQILAIEGFAAAAAKLVTQTAELNKKFDLKMSTVGLGGGFGIAYVESDEPVAIEVIAKLLNDTVIAESKKVELEVAKVTVEPGRFIVGPPGITLYTVGTVKPVTVAAGLTRAYISVDGGMSDNIRTALYDASYTAALANRSSTAPLVLSRIVGKHCESGDVVVRDCQLPADIQPGDLIAVAATGAYCRSMASQYNGTPRPAVIGIEAGQPRIWIRRETYEDLLALDLG